MEYAKELESQGYKIELEEERIHSDGQGYDLYLRIRKGDCYSESFFSMSNSKGYYYSSDFGTDCKGDGCHWDFDEEKLVCEYLEVDELEEM